MRQVVHNSAALTPAIILLCVPARSQSVPKIRVSANDLARRVITNELKFQDDRTNWMYRLEKEQYGKKQVEDQRSISQRRGSAPNLHIPPALARQADRGQADSLKRSTSLKHRIVGRPLETDVLPPKPRLRVACYSSSDDPDL